MVMTSSDDEHDGGNDAGNEGTSPIILDLAYDEG